MTLRSEETFEWVNIQNKKNCLINPRLLWNKKPRTSGVNWKEADFLRLSEIKPTHNHTNAAS